jgi:signal transduction histidine kinase
VNGIEDVRSSIVASSDATGAGATAGRPLRRWAGSVARTVGLPFRRPGVQDAAVAAVLTAASLVGVVADLHVDLPETPDGAPRGLDQLGVGLILLQTVPVAWRRRAPVAVLAVTGGALFLFGRMEYPPSLAAFGFLVALYTVAAYRSRRTSIPAVLVSVAGVAAIMVLGRGPVEADALLAELVIIGAAWWLGDGLRIRREQLIELEDRAVALERDREERAERAVAEERRVIARELHDVVAHNVTVIVAQAGAAQQIFDVAPQEAREVLGTIEHTGREALVEMRRLMGILRTHDDEDGRSPQPGLRNIDLLVSQVRNAGVPVTLAVEGTPRPLPVGLDMSAFRIVQEALTNVLKHAGPTSAHVVIRYGQDRLDLVVTDNGRGASSNGRGGNGRGFGQLGMRERVALFGGDLRVRTAPGGGYQVSASLPFEDEPA